MKNLTNKEKKMPVERIDYFSEWEYRQALQQDDYYKMKNSTNNKEKIRLLLIQAFGEWGAFVEISKDKKVISGGSKITLKYTNKILSLLETQKEEIIKIIQEIIPYEEYCQKKIINKIKKL